MQTIKTEVVNVPFEKKDLLNASSIYFIWNSDLKIFFKPDLLVVRSTNQVSFHNLIS